MAQHVDEKGHTFRTGTRTSVELTTNHVLFHSLQTGLEYLTPCAMSSEENLSHS